MIVFFVWRKLGKMLFCLRGTDGLRTIELCGFWIKTRIVNSGMLVNQDGLGRVAIFVMLASIHIRLSF